MMNSLFNLRIINKFLPKPGQKFSKLDAWCYMVCEAMTMAEKKESGELGFFADAQRLSEVWGWSRTSVRRFLDYLTSEGYIQQESHYKKRKIIL